MNRRTLSILLASLFVLGAVGLATTPGSLPGLGAPSREAGALADQGAASDPVDAALQNAGGQPPPALRQQLRNLDTARALESVADEDLSPSQRALRYIEEASRHQIASLGMTWSDEVFVPEHGSPSAAIRALAQRHGGVVGPEQEAALAAMDALPPEVARALADVVDAFHAMDLAAEQTATESDPERLAALADGGTPEALAAAGVDPSDVLAARLRLAEASLALRDILEEAGAEVPSLVVPASHGEDPSFEQPGVVCINAHDADNVYASDCTLLLDTSEEGDTRYHNNAGGKKGAGASALIDFGGDDEYGNPDVAPNQRRNEGVNGGASGAGSVGFLLDMEAGDDRYTAGNIGTNGGSSAFALGLLFDMGGNDRYTAGDTATNGGASGLASGLLVDMDGDDSYAAGGKGTNGGASGFGLGLLVDMDGDDRYKSGTGKLQSNGGADTGASGYLLDMGGRDFYEDQHIQDGSNLGSSTRGFTRCVLIHPDQLPEECEVGVWSEGFCIDCTLAGKGTTILDAGMQVDIPVSPFLGDVGDPGSLFGSILSTDCAPDGTGVLPDPVARPCWVEVLGTNVTLVSPYLKGGDGQVAAPGDRLKNDLEVWIVGTDDKGLVLVAGHQVCFEVRSHPNGGGDAELEGVEGAPSIMEDGWDAADATRSDVQDAVEDGGVPLDAVDDAWSQAEGARDAVDEAVHGESAGGLCVRTGEDGTARVRLRLGSGVGEYVTRAWSRTGGGEAGFVEFTATAMEIHGYEVQKEVSPGVWESTTGLGSVEAATAVGLRAVGLAEDGSIIRDRTDSPMGVVVMWSVDPPERGSFNPETSSTTRFTGDKSGSAAVISAIRPGLDSVKVGVDVVPGIIDSLEIRDATGKVVEELQGITVAEPVELFAFGFDVKGNLRGPAVAIWSVNRNGEISPSNTQSEQAIFTPTSSSNRDGNINIESVEENREGEQLELTINFRTTSASLDNFKIRNAAGGQGEEVTDLDPFQAGESVMLYVAGYDRFGNYRGDVTTISGPGTPGLAWDLNGLGSVTQDGGGFLFTAETVGNRPILLRHTNLDDVAEIEHVEVLPGAAVQLGLVRLGPGPLVAGDSFAVRVEVQDAYGNHNATSVADGTSVTLQMVRGRGQVEGTLETSTDDGAAVFTGLRHTVAQTITLAARLTTEAQALEGEAKLDVTPGPLDHLTIRTSSGVQAQTFTLIAGESKDFVAVGFDEFGNSLGNLETQWSQQGVGAIQSTPGGVTFTSETTGTATMRAARAGIPDATATVQVVSDTLHHIRIRDAPNGGGSEVTTLGTLRAGDARNLYAAGYDEFGNFIADIKDSWTVEPPGLGSFDAAGTRFTAEQGGAGIARMSRQGVEAALDAKVIPGNSARLALVGDPSEDMTVGEAWPPFTVRVEDLFGNLVTESSHEVMVQVGPGFADKLDGTLTRATQGGIATFDDISYRLADAVWVVARAEGLQSTANGPYIVGPAGLHSLTVHDQDGGRGHEVMSLTLTAGDQVILHAAGHDSYGNLVDIDPAWNLEGVGKITPAKDHILFTAGEAGDATLTASSRGLQAMTHITVSPGPLSRIEVRDGSGEVEALRLSVGTTRTLHAIGYDAWDNDVSIGLTWSVDPSSLGTLASIDGTSSTFTAKDRGSGTIMVRQGDVAATVRITVEAEGVAPRAAFTTSCDDLTCTFDASGSAQGDSTIASHAWDFGDQTTAVGVRRTHTYAEAGDVVVTLIVTDVDGRTGEATGTAAPALPPRPEVRLHIDIQSGVPVAGDDIEIGVLVENVGTAPASDVTVVFLLDGERVHMEVGGELAPGASRRANATTTAPPGSHTVRVEAPGWAGEDVPLTVAEPREGVAPPTADTPGPGLLTPLAVLLGALWVTRRRRHF